MEALALVDFIDGCHFSETGFALWRRNELGHTYCTCEPRPRPEGWICEDEDEAMQP